MGNRNDVPGIDIKIPTYYIFDNGYGWKEN